MNVRTLLIFAAAGLFGWSVINWRRAVRLAMVVLILEGAIRKWLLPGAQDIVYFIKDVILIGAYAGFINNRVRQPSPLEGAPLLAGGLLLSLLVGAAQVANPNLPSFAVGLLGFKSYFLYVPLLWVMPAAFSDDRDLGRFLRRYVLLAIPIGVLASMQFFAGGGSSLNVYARGESEFATTFGSSAYVRVTGTFSYITGYSSYLFATAILLLAVMAAVGWKVKGHLDILAALVMTLGGMFMTGSRGPVFLLALLFPAYWVLAVARESGFGATAARLLLAASIVGGGVAYAAPEAMEAFMGRAQGATDTLGRMTSPFTAPFSSLDDAGLFGLGIGATHQAASALVSGPNPFSWMRGIAVEAESGRVMLELGPIGFLLIYFVRLSIAAHALSTVLTLRTRFHRAIATACFLFAVAAITGTVVFDPTAAVYYWFFAGLLMAVKQLDRQMVAAQPPAAVKRPVGPRPRRRPAAPAAALRPVR